MRGRDAFHCRVIALCGSAAAAEDAPICAARPGSSTPPCTVPAGRFQVETGLAGWTVQNASGTRDTSLVIGETAFKYGLTDRSDIEVDVTPWQRSASSGPGFADRVSGFGDMTIAYKQLLTGSEAPVQLAVLPVVKVPTAARDLGNGKWEAAAAGPDFIRARQIAAQHRPDARGGLGRRRRWPRPSPRHGPGRELRLGGQRPAHFVSGAVGAVGLGPGGDGGKRAPMRSIAYLVTDNVQLDVGGNFGLNEHTPDAEIYSGVSVRF